MKKKRRTSPVVSVPQIKILLSKGYKWAGNCHDDLVEDQVSRLGEYYEEVITEQAYDRFGSPVIGELGIWVKEPKITVDDVLEAAIEEATQEILLKRDAILSLAKKGIPAEINLSIFITVDKKYITLLQKGLK